MSPLIIPSRVTCQGFPRVSGDEPSYEVTLDDGDMFSPRERG